MPPVILRSTSKVAGFATARSPSCRPRPGRSIATGSTAWPSVGFSKARASAIRELLRRVVDQAFCSSWGDDALELLGDLAFQDGRFGEALAMLQPAGGGSSRRSGCAGPSRSFGRSGAGGRQENALPRGRGRKPAGPGRSRRIWRGAIPGATGSVGRPNRGAMPRSSPKRSSRITWARSPARQPLADVRRLVPAHRRSCPGRSTWARCSGGSTSTRSSLSRNQDFRLNRGMVRQVGHPAAGAAAGVSSDRAGRPGDRLRRHAGAGLQPERSSGRRRGNVPPAGRAGLEDIRPRMAPRFRRRGSTYSGDSAVHTDGLRPPDLRADGCDEQRGFSRDESGPERVSSSIVALDWNTRGSCSGSRSRRRSLCPTDRPIEWQQSDGQLRGDARRRWAQRLRRGDRSPRADATYIACFDADTGADRWIRYLGLGVARRRQFLRYGHGHAVRRMARRATSTIGCSRSTGRPSIIRPIWAPWSRSTPRPGPTLWVATYPRQEPNQLGNGGERDLNPAVVHDGRVFVAPSDADAIFAFDAGSGRLLWKTDPIADDVKLSHLLGVAKGRLVATGNRVLLFDVKTGKLLHAWPDSGKSLEGYGRGLLAGDMIYWPTQNEIQVLDQRTGLRAEPPIKLLETYHTKGGNLVAGDGYLIVAQADGLVVFCQNSRLIERYREEIVRAPDDAANYFRLARAAEAIGQRSARARNVSASRPEGAARRDDRRDLACERGPRSSVPAALAPGGPGPESQALGRGGRPSSTSAAEVARSDPERLQAQLLLCRRLLDAGRPARRGRHLPAALDRRTAAAAGRRRRRRPSNRPRRSADRRPPQAPSSATTAARSTSRTTARPLGCFERGQGRERPSPARRGLPRLSRGPGRSRCPARAGRASRIGEAARPRPTHAYKRLLMIAPDDDRRALAIWRLAHVYEDAEALPVGPGQLTSSCRRGFPSDPSQDTGPRGTVAELVAAELARPRFTQLVADRPVPAIAAAAVPPLALAGPGGSANPVDLAPWASPRRLMRAGSSWSRKTGLRFLDPSTGLPRWSADLGAPAVWAGYLSDKLIVATPRQIVAPRAGAGDRAVAV